MVSFLSMHQHMTWVQDIALSRDRTAFEALFECFAPRIRAFLVRGGLSDTLVEELLQEVMLTVWQQAGRYRPERAAVSTWIFTIARNKKIDAYRRAARPEPAADAPGIAPKRLDAPDEVFLAQRRSGRLRTAMADMPAEQCLILRRMYFDGLSQRDIAREQSLPLGTIKSRVRLAMKHLRHALAEEDG